MLLSRVLQYYHIICFKSTQKNLNNKRKEYGQPTDWDPYQVRTLGSLVPNYRYILHLKFIMFMQVDRFEKSLSSGIHNNVRTHTPKWLLHYDHYELNEGMALWLYFISYSTACLVKGNQLSQIIHLHYCWNMSWEKCC
jgi:hypothetical protein